MMSQRDFVILTDVNADLPVSYTEAENIGVISMSIQIDGKSYEPGKDIDADTFYKMMRAGKEPTTAASNPHQYEQAFKQVLDSGKDVLYLAFSSALSSSYQSAVMAREMLEEEYCAGTKSTAYQGQTENAKNEINKGIQNIIDKNTENSKNQRNQDIESETNEDKDNRADTESVGNIHFPSIIIIDTLSGSMGQGLLVYKANELKKQGKSLDEVVTWCEANKRNICHEFVLDDLMHMHRGGRLSKNSAILGSLLHVKPLIYLDDESKVLSSGHVRGSKKAIRMLIERMAKCMESRESKGGSNCIDGKTQESVFEDKPFENKEDIVQEPVVKNMPENTVTSAKDFISQNQDMIMICHSDCEQAALQLKEQIEEAFGFKNVMIHTAGPVIGCHAGPGAVGVFFMGER